ncbi:MAG: hypothetical protein ACOC2H_02490 [Spirochaetota bacterium]
MSAQPRPFLQPKAGVEFGIQEFATDDTLNFLDLNRNITLVAYSPLVKGDYVSHEKPESFYDWEKFNTNESKVRPNTACG